MVLPLTDPDFLGCYNREFNIHLDVDTSALPSTSARNSQRKPKAKSKPKPRSYESNIEIENAMAYIVPPAETEVVLTSTIIEPISSLNTMGLHGGSVKCTRPAKPTISVFSGINGTTNHFLQQRKPLKNKTKPMVEASAVKPILAKPTPKEQHDNSEAVVKKDISGAELVKKGTMFDVVNSDLIDNVVQCILTIGLDSERAGLPDAYIERCLITELERTLVLVQDAIQGRVTTIKACSIPHK